MTEPRLRLTMENKQTTNPVVMSYRAHPSTLVVAGSYSGTVSPHLSRSARISNWSCRPEWSTRPVTTSACCLATTSTSSAGDGAVSVSTPARLSPSTRRAGHVHPPAIGRWRATAWILGACVELQDVASRSDLAVLARYATDPEEAEQLRTMSGLDEAGREAYRERVAAPRRSVLELLDEFPSCNLPFNVYLELLPPIGLATTPSPPPLR